MTIEFGYPHHGENMGIFLTLCTMLLHFCVYRVPIHIFTLIYFFYLGIIFCPISKFGYPMVGSYYEELPFNSTIFGASAFCIYFLEYAILYDILHLLNATWIMPLYIIVFFIDYIVHLVKEDYKSITGMPFRICCNVLFH